MAINVSSVESAEGERAADERREPRSRPDGARSERGSGSRGNGRSHARTHAGDQDGGEEKAI